MKSYKEFITEALKRTGKKIKVSTTYHGTTQSRADSIKKDGFKSTDGRLGSGVYSTPSKKDASFHAKRHSTDSDKPAIIQMKSVSSKKNTHKIHGRNMYDRSKSKDPSKRDVSKRIKDRAQAHLKRGKSVKVINTTDKEGKTTGSEVIQSPEKATKSIVKNPSPIIRKRKNK